MWLGSLESKTLTGILCAFDMIKRDAEIKLLIGCAHDEVQVIQNFHHQMLTFFLPNPPTHQ